MSYLYVGFWVSDINKYTMLRELFARNKNIIVNTDIDGFLCGAILQKYYGCRIVGFSNSRETIWVSPEIDDIYKPCYIDLYVNRPDVVCIEQHIISFNARHHKRILGYGTKINPNLERGRTFVGDMQSDYYHKYPFGTVHYLMALMAREGVQVELPALGRTHTYKGASCTVGHLILRADDALYSTLSPYRDNALDWWLWLEQSGSVAVSQLKGYVDSCDINKARDYKSSVAGFFKAFGCNGTDGTFNNITDDAGNILEKVQVYSKEVGFMIGMELGIPAKYTIHKGVYGISSCRRNSYMDILESDRLYSYAFIYGPNCQKENFSYTVDMK